MIIKNSIFTSIHGDMKSPRMAVDMPCTCRTMSRGHESVFDDPDVAAELAEIHERFVVVPADKASNNIMFVCKTHYITA